MQSRKSWFTLPLFFILSVFLLLSCNNEIDVLAEYKPYMTVYAIFNAQDTVHYVRIAKVFQTEGDALVYAQNTDLSYHQAKVVLTSDSGQIVFLPDTILRDSGDFYRSLVVYRGTGRVKPNGIYTLRVEVLDDQTGETLIAEGTTQIPSAPYISQPDSVELGSGNTQAYPSLNFEKDIVIGFYPYNPLVSWGRHSGSAFELRIYLDYAIKQPDGTLIPQPTLVFKPRGMFTGKEAICNAPLCYRLGANAYIEFLKSRLSDSTVTYVYDDSPKSKAARIEITAMDAQLYKFLLASIPAFEDFTEVKPQYTNVTLTRIKHDGSQEQYDGIGIVGSYNTGYRYIRLGACTQYKAGLNEIPVPPDNCQ